MKVKYYALVNKNGNMITTDRRLPIYWNKKVAEIEAELFKATIKPIWIHELERLIQHPNQ